MKKLIIYGGTIVLLFAALFVVTQMSEKSANEKYEEKAQELYGKPASELTDLTKKLLNDKNYQNIILPEELNNLIESGEEAYVYFFAPDCPYCMDTTPTLMEMADEENVTIHQFNVREFDYRSYNIASWPTVLYYKDGEVLTYIGSSIKGREDLYREFLTDPVTYEAKAQEMLEELENQQS